MKKLLAVSCLIAATVTAATADSLTKENQNKSSGNQFYTGFYNEHFTELPEKQFAEDFSGSIIISNETGSLPRVTIDQNLSLSDPGFQYDRPGRKHEHILINLMCL